MQQLVLLHVLAGLDTPQASPEAALATAQSVEHLLYDGGALGSFLRSQRKAYLRALWLLQVRSGCKMRCETSDGRATTYAGAKAHTCCFVCGKLAA